MKQLLVILILTASINSLSAQTEKIIDKKSGNIYYGHFSKKINSEKDLPKNVQSNLKGYLNKILPSMIDSIKFSHGQIIDLEKMFKEEPVTFNKMRIVPKYELTFYLKNKSIGIKNYNLEIGLDEYGQILETNWPKETLLLNNFKSLTEIETIALNHAKNKKIDYKSYDVNLVYEKDIDKLFWIINLHVKAEESTTEFYRIEIPWNSLKISNKSTAYQNTMY
ncbi:hypothetical protein B0A67_15675 [Flavobacterium aquidurense]|uniref:hypothetical protein n=1 Tax=Flavobacterium aquidurense TaxID=362413 RepID=UPI00091DC4B2|nr:hypothetical protein [Flavobacterium aquidurense]OXA70454.1 hypothetical protein B0A67_15675 [Flavobacterium aquidurense]SHH73191.1 hypothetical protein SAMN05444481_12541 [Flavobacterium frigidimaris]